MTPPRTREPRPGAWRVAVAIGVATVGVVGVAVLASGVRGAGDERSLDVGGGALGSISDAVVFAVLTMGIALTIAMFIAQFGGDREERKEVSTGRRVLTVVIFVGAVFVAAPVISRVSERLDLDLGTEEAGEVDETGAEGGAEGPSGRPTVEEGADDRGDGGVLAGLAIGAALVGVAATLLWVRRLRGGGEPIGVIGDTDHDEAALLRGLLDDAIAQLRADPDPRRAVITTWARLEVALAASGRPRHDAEAPLAYLERVLVAVRTSEPAVRRLAASFERAMFSPHTIGADEQAEAVDALVAVRDELGVEARR